MRPKFTYLGLFLLLLTCCVDNKTQYTCPDGTIVSDSDKCPINKVGTAPTSLACKSPYVLIGADCCLDEDKSGVCDTYETATTTTEMITTTLLIASTTFVEPEKTTTSLSATTTSNPGNVVCYKSADCGVNGKKVVKYYTCQPSLDGKVYRRYIEYVCRHPGTAASECIGTEKTELLKTCDFGGCMEGTPVCRATKGLWLWVGKKTCNTTTCPGYLTLDKTKKTCNVTCPGFVTLNNTKDWAAYYSPNRYDIKVNYITSSPTGVNISVKPAGKAPVDVFLTYDAKDVDDLEIQLSAILMDYNPVVRIYLSKKNPTATTATTRVPVTFPPLEGDNVPAGAQVLRDITKDKYAASYMGYSFKINEVIYLEHDPGSVKVDIMKPNGTFVTVEVSSEFPEKVDDLLIGTFTDYRTLEAVIWVYKPQ
jgi:hypothetical protein